MDKKKLAVLIAVLGGLILLCIGVVALLQPPPPPTEVPLFLVHQTGAGYPNYCNNAVLGIPVGDYYEVRLLNKIVQVTKNEITVDGQTSKNHSFTSDAIFVHTLWLGLDPNSDLSGVSHIINVSRCHEQLYVRFLSRSYQLFEWKLNSYMSLIKFYTIRCPQCLFEDLSHFGF